MAARLALGVMLPGLLVKEAAVTQIEVFGWQRFIFLVLVFFYQIRVIYISYLVYLTAKLVSSVFLISGALDIFHVRVAELGSYGSILIATSRLRNDGSNCNISHCAYRAFGSNA